MHSPEQRIAELHYELGLLRTALEFMKSPADRSRILAHASACIAEYLHLVDGRLSTAMLTDEPRTEHSSTAQ
jgi:hypothetical protein